MRHDALANFLLSMREQVPLSGEDRLLAVTTIGFDIAALELYLPLLGGATAVVVPSGTVKDIPALLGTIASSGATVMQATPTLWQALLSQVDEHVDEHGQRTDRPIRACRQPSRQPRFGARFGAHCACGSADAGGRRGAERSAVAGDGRARPLGEQPVWPDRDDDLVGGHDARWQGARWRAGLPRCDP